MGEAKFTKSEWVRDGLSVVTTFPNGCPKDIGSCLPWPEGEANACLFAAAPKMFALLEKALPIIEAEANLRDAAMWMHGEAQCITSYWREMRNLANEIKAAIAKARGESEAKDG